MAEEGILYYKRQQKLCQLIQNLALNEVSLVTNRILTGEYNSSDLPCALSMIEKDAIFDVKEAKATAIQVAEKVMQDIKQRIAMFLDRARIAEQLLEEFQSIVAELQGEHGGIL